MLLHSHCYTMFAGSTFMGVNHGWECILQTEDNRDGWFDHVQSWGWGNGECLAQIAQILRNENIYIPIFYSHLLIIAPLVF